jgi:hypothetical protein
LGGYAKSNLPEVRRSKMTSNEPVGLFKFGGNDISADSTGKFTIKLVNGGEWFFDVDEIGRLDEILGEFEQGVKEKTERVFWRTNGTKVIQLVADTSKVYLVSIRKLIRERFRHKPYEQKQANFRVSCTNG